MASTYTDGLAVEIIGSGDKVGSWGDVTNNNLKALEEGISRYAEIAIVGGSATSTLDIPDGQTAYTDDSKGRSAVIKWTGSPSTGTHHTVTLQVGGATATQARFTAINGLGSTHTLRITTATMDTTPAYLEIPNGYSAEIHIDNTTDVTKSQVINSLSGLLVEKIALKNNEIISNETNDEIIIAADTVKVGDDGAATLSSNGDQDLILKTGNTTTGSITITDGANGNVTVAPNGTGVLSTTDALISGSGGYINFNTTISSGGIGLRENSGEVEYRASTGEGWGSPYTTGLVSGQGTYFKSPVNVGAAESGSLVAGDAGSTAHGLGSVPRIVVATIECLTTDGGYADGDFITINSGLSSTSNYGISIYFTDEVVGFALPIGLLTAWMILPVKTGGANFTLAPAAWDLWIEAWK